MAHGNRDGYQPAFACHAWAEVLEWTQAQCLCRCASATLKRAGGASKCYFYCATRYAKSNSEEGGLLAGDGEREQREGKRCDYQAYAITGGSPVFRIYAKGGGHTCERERQRRERDVRRVLDDLVSAVSDGCESVNGKKAGNKRTTAQGRMRQRELAELEQILRQSNDIDIVDAEPETIDNQRRQSESSHAGFHQILHPQIHTHHLRNAEEEEDEAGQGRLGQACGCCRWRVS